MMRSKYFVAGIFTLAASLPAQAWDHGGHMLVAQVAYNRLDANVKAQVDALVPQIPDFRKPEKGVKPQPYSFVTAAAWMDDVRSSKKREAYGSWHYIDMPCGGNPSDVKEQNALDAINLAKIVLRSPQADSKTKAEWLAILLHLVGDLHQPLHCTNQEVGGNTFAVADVPGLDLRLRADGKSVDKDKPATGVNKPVYGRLHALWDSGYRYDVVKRNGRQSAVLLYDLGNSAKPNLARVRSNALGLNKYLLSDKVLLNENNPAQWVRESNAIACDWVFSTPKMQKPSTKYFDQMHATSCQRMVLAGVRLANTLNVLFRD